MNHKKCLLQGVTYLAGNLYTEYQDIKDIRGIINGYQLTIDQILIKYLSEFSRIFKKYLQDTPK